MLSLILLFTHASAITLEKRVSSLENQRLFHPEEQRSGRPGNMDYLKISTYRDTSSTRDVKIGSGTVRGHEVKDTFGDYVAFLGIPYAAPPIGRLRFMAPLPPKPWSKILIANRTVRCPQRGTGDEDCLIINVFTPITLRMQLPVLVYIHPGAFLTGFGPTRGMGLLTKHNFVVVTFNYRLGVLGFLCLGIGEALGNAGLKDQTAALQWVQRNIQQFGGDPGSVTLYGVSSAAALVELHILAGVKDEVLFHKAIIESGSATSVWALDSDPIDTAKRFTNMLKPERPIRNLDEMVDFLKNKTAGELSKVNYELYRSLTDGTFGFAPCLENKYSRDAFILDSPHKLLKTRNYDVPIMFIYSSFEGIGLRSSEYYELNYKYRMNENFIAFMPRDLNVDTELSRKIVSKKVRREYFGPKGIINDEQLLGYLNYFGDSLIMHGMFTSLKKHSERPGLRKSVYLMEFAYKSERGYHDQFYEYFNLAGHGDVARNLISDVSAGTSDNLTAKRLAKLLSNFVMFSNPTPTYSPFLPIPWPPVQPGNLTYLYVDHAFSVYQHQSSSRIRLWDELYLLYRKRVHPVNPFIYF